MRHTSLVMLAFPAVAAAVCVLSMTACVPPSRAKYQERGLRGRFVEVGIASWYGMDHGRVKEHGGLTASGRRFDQNALTAAHKTLPLGTRVMVTSLENGKRVLVVINDRGPYIEGRIIDLTLRGARVLGFEQKGFARVRVEAIR